MGDSASETLVAEEGVLKEGRKAKQSRRTILVVDDEEIVRKTLHSILEQMGYCVLAAIDTRQAGKLFAQHASELALMIIEIGMPSVTGPQFVERLPTLTPRVPVLFITSMGEEEEEKAVKKFQVLRKPFSADALMGCTSLQKAR